jgi:hypothetical protein
MDNGEIAKVMIGIVTYNHRKFISKCLDSVARCAKLKSVKVIVVDNCSTDGSADVVRNQYPWVELIERVQVDSFASNNNVAFSRYPSEYFLMLNPDTELDEGVVDTLVQFMVKNPSCGLCGPKLVFPDGSLQYSCRRFPTLWSTLIRRSPLRLLFPAQLRSARHLMASESHDNDMVVDWMLGACLLVRRSTIVGDTLLDEGFPLYCEEIDLCLRLKHGGWKRYYVPCVKVVHHHLAKSDASLFCRASFLHFRSMIHFAKKHYLPLEGGSAARLFGINRYQP